MIRAQESVLCRSVREALHMPDPFTVRSALLLEQDPLQGHSPIEMGPGPEPESHDEHGLDDEVPIL